MSRSHWGLILIACTVLALLVVLAIANTWLAG
jgi:hypothetical protein